MSNLAAVRHRGGTAGRIPRVATALLIALTAGIAAFFLVRYAALPLLTIRTVVLAGDAPFPRDEALRLAGLAPVEYWPTVPCAQIQGRLEASPLVRRARVERVFPSTLRLVVDRRLPSALVLAQSGGRTVPLLVDGDGYVFKVGESGAELDLPVISGIPAGEMRLGAALPRAYVPLLADLRALREREPGLAALLSEVRVAGDPGAGGPGAVDGARAAGAAGEQDLVLYLTTAGVPVRVRGPVDASLVKYTLMVMDLLSKQGLLGDIQELDFRSGQVVYRMKEG
jgi:cell division protein FtsQ